MAYEIPSAATARTKSIDRERFLDNLVYQRQKEAITNSINLKIDAGHQSLWAYENTVGITDFDNLHPRLVEELRTLGYKVTNDCISWSDPGVK